ncbi:MAG TPA: hypothetical protein VLH08_00485 [Acidobacteriota bacterium]|nr:hypothetical protein [Acidobacteriota bacterium]
MSKQGTGMSSFLKAAILVMAGIVFFGTILLIAGWWWWKSNQKEITQSTLKARQEGKNAGVNINEQECLNLSVTRTAAEIRFTEIIANGVFLGGCLETSNPVDGFCKGVPKDSEFSRSIGWRKSKCTTLKLEQNKCSALLSVVQRYCHEDRKRLGKIS